MSDEYYSPDLPVNAQFEQRYVPRTPLGFGGVAEVMLYRDRWIGREVAIKTVRASDDDSNDLSSERFLREARVQGQLEHPSIVPVYECGVRPDGREYFAMKRVHGRTLADVLKARAQEGLQTDDIGSYGRRRLLEAFTRVCQAVDYAHAHGIVHRDLKPTNIMLGDFGEVYVLDWGVAKVRGPSFSVPPSSLVETPRLDGTTDPGAWLGTPGYMAPEQLGGGEIGPRTDVYALGAILFEILTGEPLHRLRVPVELVSSTLAGVEARPSARCPELGVPPEFDAILACATARNPADRYPSARSLHQEVERFLDGDRDLALRREMAERHAEVARAVLARLQTDPPRSDERHAEALRNLGRALVLDPNNRDAVELLGSLLLHRPAQEPVEVRVMLEQSRATQRREAVRALFLRSLTWAVFVPITVWLGYTAPQVAYAVLALVLGTVGLLGRLRRLPRVSSRLMLGLLLLTSVVFVGLSAMFGPFILIPALVATNTVFFVLHTPRRQRWLVFALGVLTITLPFGAEILGLVPPSYQFTGKEIIVHARALAF
ncbi:serine/threonine protein kinase, partial [Myxococcota bacterium]